ncbi:MAG: hypothetical protein GEU78_07745 [Actinobacteria bacterium]|nr:hypothetical protein [Actinomycetota bacterium]MQB00171.1 hypothetical protein [Actinomycetota bacterium]
MAAGVSHLRLRCAPADMGLFSSPHWDVSGAISFDMQAALVNRRAASREQPHQTEEWAKGDQLELADTYGGATR